MNDLQHEPLQATDAEISVLGAAMSGADIDELARIVEPGDFYDPRRGLVWSAILRVHAAGNRPDVISVRLAMDTGGDKNDPIEMFRWTELAPAIASAAHYAEAVAVASGHRAIATAGIKITQLGNTLSDDLPERRETARQIIDEACQGRSVTRVARLGDDLAEVLDIAQNGTAATLSTPWPDIDHLIDGLAPGRLVVIGGRPGAGKSLAGVNLALHMAHRHQHAALVASMEMSKTEVEQRVIASHARVNLSGLIKGQTDEASWSRINAAYSDMDAMPLYIDDTPAQTVQHIRGKARDVQRMRDDLALIVVDYLQLMGTRDSGNRATDLGEISRGLKLLARETGACVVALAQVNRESTKRGDRPRMSDLRESGSIEADADQVLLLHQPDEEIPEVEVVVDKNRHGAKGIRTLAMWGHYALLSSTARVPGGVA